MPLQVDVKRCYGSGHEDHVSSLRGQLYVPNREGRLSWIRRPRATDRPAKIWLIVSAMIQLPAGVDTKAANHSIAPSDVDIEINKDMNDSVNYPYHPTSANTSDVIFSHDQKAHSRRRSNRPN
jgi:hypothetical protein